MVIKDQLDAVNFIRVAMYREGMTVKELADKIYVSQPALSKVFSGKSGIQLYRLLDVLNVLGYEMILERKEEK